jgi:hypothetical protein
MSILTVAVCKEQTGFIRCDFLKLIYRYLLSLTTADMELAKKLNF